MKYQVTYSCGHTDMVDLGGKNAERERRLKWLAECGLCPECYAAYMEERKTDGCEIVEMLYRDYKNNYSDCKTMKDSYNPENKTITVYVPTPDSEDYEYLLSKFGEETTKKMITEARQHWGQQLRKNVHEAVIEFKKEDQ